jgi:hypothetical protein
MASIQRTREEMASIVRTSMMAVAAAALAACGGGDSADLPPVSLREQAIQQQAAALARIQTGPCTANSQCSYVTFFEPIFSCSQGTYAPYVKVSRTANFVVEAAEEQRRTALKARALEPPPNFACIQSVDIVNSVCVQSACALTLGGPIITIEPG